MPALGADLVALEFTARSPARTRQRHPSATLVKEQIKQRSRTRKNTEAKSIWRSSTSQSPSCTLSGYWGAILTGAATMGPGIVNRVSQGSSGLAPLRSHVLERASQSKRRRCTSTPSRTASSPSACRCGGRGGGGGGGGGGQGPCQQAGRPAPRPMPFCPAHAGEEPQRGAPPEPRRAEPSATARTPPAHDRPEATVPPRAPRARA